ncbi:MAG: exodeoxyribonuclease VII large subunit [Lentisphaeria bacterium]|nr:exodeoxyribonuclease VII large subunit [Lentisphaeria bacterium]
MNDQTPVFSVSDVNAMVRDTLEGTFMPFWITGETGNLTIHRSGHVYLTLKDASSQIKAVYFNGAEFCRSIGLREGMKIEGFGKLSVYAPRGEYQMNLRSIRPYGIGDLQVKFEELKRRLAAEGLFDSARKKPIPFLPQRIGVISSPSGAALKDFIRIANSRFSRLHIQVYPAPVQGAGAERILADGIRFFNRVSNPVDVIVLTRGGGSLEDLWPFNEEELARAIGASQIPVISAVGHEIDFTIADFVADLRAPTPSGAAEMLIPEEDGIQQHLTSSVSRMQNSVLYQLERAQNRLDTVSRSKAFTDLNYQLDERMQRIDMVMDDALTFMNQTLERAQYRLSRSESVMNAFNPYGVLKRGYAILTKQDGSVVREAEKTAPGDILHARVADGSFDVSVLSQKDG